MQQEEEDLSKELAGVLNEFRTLEDVQEDWQRRRDNPARRKYARYIRATLNRGYHYAVRVMLLEVPVLLPDDPSRNFCSGSALYRPEAAEAAGCAGLGVHGACWLVNAPSAAAQGVDRHLRRQREGVLPCRRRLEQG